MSSIKLGWPVKTGLLLVALSWFSFTFYEFIINIIRGGGVNSPFWITLTDTASAIGLGFRTAASFIAVITILFYIVRRDLSTPEALMSVRWILIFEAAYFAVSFFPSGVWGVVVTSAFGSGSSLLTTIESTLPCLVISTLIPAVLIKLFFELNPKKAGNGIKWGLIAGVAYIFVFWLNNTGNWIAAIIQKGTDYVTLYPLNMLSLALTSAGLLLLAIYAAVFSRRFFGKMPSPEVDLKKVGAIITATGLYFNVIYMLWILFDSVGGWSYWYAWFLGHNVELWVMSLPLVGLPLLFHKKN
jgi:hypothetical protein